MTRLVVLAGFLVGHLATPAFAAPPAPRTVTVTSAPPNAQVSVNGADVGVTPVAVQVPPGAKQNLVVTLKGFETVTRRLQTARAGETIHLVLVDAELKQLERNVEKARAAGAKANTRLEQAQDASSADPDSDGKARALEKADASMQSATDAIEDAERALARAQNERMSASERAQSAARVRAAMERPIPPPSVAASPAVVAAVAPPAPKRSEATVFCAWKIPVRTAEKGWVTLRNGCFAAPVSAAVAACNSGAKSESPDAPPCDCTDDAVVAAKCR